MLALKASVWCVYVSMCVCIITVSLENCMERIKHLDACLLHVYHAYSILYVYFKHPLSNSHKQPHRHTDFRFHKHAHRPLNSPKGLTLTASRCKFRTEHTPTHTDKSSALLKSAKRLSLNELSVSGWEMTGHCYKWGNSLLQIREDET